MLAQLQYRTEIHKHNLYQVLCGTESVVELDPELVNVFDNPWITAMTWQHASLEAGDCLLIPAGIILWQKSIVSFKTDISSICELNIMMNISATLKMYVRRIDSLLPNLGCNLDLPWRLTGSKLKTYINLKSFNWLNLLCSLNFQIPYSILTHMAYVRRWATDGMVKRKAAKKRREWKEMPGLISALIKLHW